MVRVIRTFRPDVICTRFQGSDRDGHGNHQASGILTREAFRAAADPTRFPDQIREGLQPWQAKKLYMDNVRSNEDWTIKLETSQNDPLLGETYVKFAWKGLQHQLSQGAGAWHFNTDGPRYSYYKLIDSASGKPIPANARKRFPRWNRHLVARSGRAPGSRSVEGAVAAGAIAGHCEDGGRCNRCR